MAEVDWVHQVHPEGLMRCCQDSLDEAMRKARKKKVAEPAIGTRVKCASHQGWVIRGLDGVWQWDMEYSVARDQWEVEG